MKLTSRERWLLALLPPLLLLGLWGHIVGDRLGARTVEARKQLFNGSQEGAGAEVDPAVDLEARLEWTREHNTLLVRNLTERKAHRDALIRDGSELTKHWSHATERASSVKQLLQIMESMSVSVQRSEALRSNDLEFKPSQRLQELANGMQELEGESPQVWRFEVEGSYGAVCDTLRSCTQLEQFALPVTLSARPLGTRHGGEGHLAFTLWFWI